MLPVKLNEALLEDKLAALEAARSWSPRVISRLEALIRTGDDYDLYQINPVRYALDKGMKEDEAIALFLYAAKAGIFTIEWHLVCPSCAHLVESLNSMDHLHSHYVCDMCSAKTEATLDDYIQVTFTISPLLRDLVYHHPDTLPIEDLYFKCRMCKAVAPLPGGQRVLDVLLKYTRLLTYLNPHEKKTVELDLPKGFLRLTDFLSKAMLAFLVDEVPIPATHMIPVKLIEGKFDLPDLELTSKKLDTPNFTFELKQAGKLSNGKLTLEIENTTDRRGGIWIFFTPEDLIPPRLEFESFLSGKKLLTNQTFRDLYRFEVIRNPEGIGVKDLTYLFTDLKGSTDLYDSIGDPHAFYLVMQHFDALVRAVAAHSGAIVKTIGDAIMATFMTPVEAIKAAIDMLREIDTFNQGISQRLALKIGIHKGHSIAVTLNDRLDYFGQTVNIASRIQGLAGANEIYVSQEVYDYPGVAEVLSEYHTTAEKAAIRGVNAKMEVYKITLNQ